MTVRTEELHCKKESLPSELAEAMVQAAPVGFILLDREGQITWHNAEAERLLTQPLRAQSWRELAQRLFSPKNDDGHEISLIDDKKIHLRLVPLKKEGGQLLVLTDLTESRAFQSHSAHLERLSALGQMSAGIAHDIRTPLATAILYTEQLEQLHAQEDEKKRCTLKILSSLKKLEQRVRDLLQWAKGGDLHRQIISAEAFTEQLLESLKPLWPLNHPPLAVEQQAGGEYLYVHVEAMLSCLQNIVQNSLQAAVKPIQVQFKIEKKPTFIELSIEDNGPGINPTLQQHVMAPFFTTRPQGTGLGLPMAQAIIQAHQGHLHLESQAQQGTRVTIQLPLIRHNA